MTDRTAAVTTGMLLLYDGLALSVHFELGDWVLGRLAKILVAMHHVHQRGCCYFVNFGATFPEVGCIIRTVRLCPSVCQSASLCMSFLSVIHDDKAVIVSHATF